MSMSSRPVSLQAALMLKRAREERDRPAVAAPAARRRSVFRLARLLGLGQDLDEAGENEPRRQAA